MQMKAGMREAEQGFENDDYVRAPQLRSNAHYCLFYFASRYYILKKMASRIAGLNGVFILRGLLLICLANQTDEAAFGLALHTEGVGERRRAELATGETRVFCFCGRLHRPSLPIESAATTNCPQDPRGRV